MRIKTCFPSKIPESWYGEVIGFDIETEGLSIESEICMISIFNPKEDVAIVIPIKVYKNGDLHTIYEYSGELDILKRFLSSIKAVGANLQFDISSVLYHWGVEINPYFDTFIFARVMQWEEQSLKGIVARIRPDLSPIIFKYDNLFDTNNITYDIGREEVVRYSALDAVFPFIIIENNLDRINKVKKTLDIEFKFLKVASRIRAKGLRIDESVYQRRLSEYSKVVDEEQKKLDQLAGRHIRVNSTKDLKEFLVDELGIPAVQYTAKGAVSLNIESLTRMLDNERNNKFNQEVIQLVLDLKSHFSILNSSKKMPDFLIDSYLHPTIEQIGYDGTSRVYSKDPSINQYPKPFRQAFIPNEGKKFVYFDLSSAELHIAAYWSKCHKILDWLANGVDVHSEVSRLLLNKEEITKEERGVSKTVTFATIFGSEGSAVSRALNISEDEGVALVKKYGEIFPEITQLRSKLISMARNTTYTRTMIGRLRRLPKIKSDYQMDREKAERQAFNTAIQGSCADFFKIGATKTLKYEDEGVAFVFGVFDSFLLEVPEDMSEGRVKQIVDDIVDFSDLFEGLKFNYKMAIGHDWLDVCERT